LVIYSSVFPGAPLYEAMLQDDMFEPFIIVIPDILHGEKNMFLQMEQTYTNLSKKYVNIKKSYDKITEKFVDFSNNIDLVCTANPYESMTKEMYRMQRFIWQGVLPFYIPYSVYGLHNYTFNFIINTEFHNEVWKIFSESDINVLSEKMYNLGSNLVLTGYCKMDNIAKIKYVPRDRKRIIIASHLTILHSEHGLNMSTFLEYYNFFIELFEIYPNIDFVFRPHPLLFAVLQRSDVWGEAGVEKYMQDLSKHSNVVYDTSGDYFDLFVNSDALIHDCCSFEAEYMYTDHPQCYLVKDNSTIDKEFSDFGKEVLKHTYKAYYKKDILNFIDNVVINGNDTMKNDRINFANKYIKINYPHATEKIIEYIKKKLS
jgi:hypothetical protein